MGKATTDFEILKKYYGENFAKLARFLFPTILENKGKLVEIIEEHFAHSHELYADIVKANKVENFKNFIMEKYSNKDNHVIDETVERPEVLFKKAGYKLYKCENNDDINSFKHYYKGDEELCTFRDTARVYRYDIFFAVKDNAENIQRFPVPRRQDDYGTSVISLQFSKGARRMLSIKNRYNHTVDNPDATFSNDLENIHAGLTDSFEKYYGINIRDSQTYNFELKNYVMAGDGKFYKYNREINNVYFCPNNVIIDNGKVINLDKSKYDILDTYILDKTQKQVITYNQFSGDFKKIEEGDDGFTKLLRNNISKLKMKNVDDNHIFEFLHKNGEKTKVTTNKDGLIIKFETDTRSDIHINFLSGCTNVKSFIAPNVKVIKDYCLSHAHDLEEIDVSSVEEIGFCFLMEAPKLKSFEAKNLKSVGYSFLHSAPNLKNINLDSIENILSSSLEFNIIEKANFPNLIEAGDHIFGKNQTMKELNIPKAVKLGNYFLANNVVIDKISADNLEDAGSNFINAGGKFISVNFPSLNKLSNYFLHQNNSIIEANFPSVKIIDSDVLSMNNKLKFLNISNATSIGSEFLYSNNTLEEFKADRALSIGENVLKENNKIKKMYLKNVKSIYGGFMQNGCSLISFVAPNLISVGHGFLENQKYLEVFDAGNLSDASMDASKSFLRHCWRLKFFNSKLSRVNKIRNLKVKLFVLKQERERNKRIVQEFEENEK